MTGSGRLNNEIGDPAYDLAREVFAPGGVALVEGDLLVQPELADTFTLIAENGTTWKDILKDIYSLSEYVSNMLRISLSTFDDLDVDGALEVLNMGLKLDDQLQSILRRLSTFIMEDSRNVGNFVDIVLGIRALERFGGHAKNIAGHLVFIKHGIDVRHEGVDAIIRKIEERL